MDLTLAVELVQLLKEVRSSSSDASVLHSAVSIASLLPSAACRAFLRLRSIAALRFVAPVSSCSVSNWEVSHEKQNKRLSAQTRVKIEITKTKTKHTNAHSQQTATRLPLLRPSSPAWCCTPCRA